MNLIHRTSLEIKADTYKRALAIFQVTLNRSFDHMNIDGTRYQKLIKKCIRHFKLAHYKSQVLFSFCTDGIASHESDHAYKYATMYLRHMNTFDIW